MKRLDRVGRYLACLVAAMLALYSAFVVALVLHEGSHAIAGRLLGGEVRGIVVSPLWVGGLTYTAYPYSGVPEIAPRIVAAAGPISGLLLGTIVFLLWWKIERAKNSLLVLFFAIVPLGGHAVDLMSLGVWGPTRNNSGDIVHIFEGLGVEIDTIRVVAGTIGTIGVLMLGLWFCRAALRVGSRYLDPAGCANRVAIVVTMTCLPGGALLLLIGLLRILFDAAPAPPGSPVSAAPSWSLPVVGLGILLAASAIACWAHGTSTWKPMTDGPASRPWPPLLRLSIVTALAATLIFWVGWHWDLDRTATRSADDMTRRIARDPTDVSVLQRALYWSERAGRTSEVREYQTRLLEQVAGPIKPLIMQGRRQRADGRLDEALETFQRAEQARPDLAMIHLYVAATHEDRGDFAAAAESWRRFVTLCESSRRLPSCTLDALSLARSRIPSLEQAARSGEPGEP